MPLTYFRPRGDIKSNWELANPILQLREMGLEWETTVGVGKTKIKFGDGVTAWNNLNYAVDVASSIQLDTKSNWTSKNPVLGKGEMGLEWETTVGVGEINIKVGDGTTAWNDLSYGLTSDITNKAIKTITEYSGDDENPALADGDTLSVAAGKLNEQQTFLKNTLGYERLATMAETLGGLSNEDFMGVMEKLNSIKFNKTDVYNGTDSTSTSLAASANALKTVKDLTDTNTTAISQLNSDLNGRLIRGSDFTGLNAPAQSDGSYYRVQLLSSGQFRIAKNIGGSFDSWNDFLTNADIGQIYWGGVSSNISVSAGQWTAASKKITVPAGTYILMAHATIPGGLNKYGKIRIGLSGLYETTQSWYPSNDIIEVNLTTFMTISEQLTVGVKLTSEASVTVTSAEIAALRIK